MSKLNIGVGEDFPLGDAPNQSQRHHNHCARQGRRHRHGPGPAAALLLLPAAAASVTAAIIYPLVTLGVIGGVGLAAAAHRRSRWRAYREAYRAHRDKQAANEAKPSDTPPKEAI